MTYASAETDSRVTYEELLVVDGLTFSAFADRDRLAEMKHAGITCVTNTCSIWEGALETIKIVRNWDLLIDSNGDIARKVQSAGDIPAAKSEGKLGVLYGLQNSSGVNGDLDFVEVMYRIGVRMMQLTYNNQNEAASGCYEASDGGISRFGCELIREMNKAGVVVDLSHTGDRSCVEAIKHSTKPVAISHANPKWFNNVARNISDDVLKALEENNGVIGVSAFPMLLPGGSPEFVRSNVTLREFAEMIARLVEQIGIAHVGVGSDQGGGHTDQSIQYARMGTWTRTSQPRRANEKPDWAKGGSAEQVPSIFKGLREVGFQDREIRQVMGENWVRLFRANFG